MKNAVVIGAGVGGLATAIRLQHKGYKVEVFEASDSPGGKLKQFEENGFRFDKGPSLFTMPDKVEELLQIDGEKSTFSYKKLDEVCRYFYSDDTIIHGFGNAEAFTEEVTKKLKIPKDDILNYLKKSKFIFEATDHLFLNKSLHKIKSYLNVETLISILKLPFIGTNKSMHKANKTLLKHPKLVQLFNRFATYNGSNPYKAPATLNLIPHLEFSLGAYFPKNGMYDITSSLYKKALSLGVKFNFNTEVEEIIVNNRNITEVKTNTRSLKSDVVVSNVDVVPFYKNILKDQKLLNKCISKERSSSALIFYWGISREFSQLKLHNILFSKNYEEEFKYIFGKKELYSDPTVYINITSKEKPNDAPSGCENWFVMINVPSLTNYDREQYTELAKKHIVAKINDILKTSIEQIGRAHV